MERLLFRTNKSCEMICSWQVLLLTERFISIEHTFPLPGHTFLDSDRDFDNLQLQLGAGKILYTVDVYETIMCNLLKRPKPTVTPVCDKKMDI